MKTYIERTLEKIKKIGNEKNLWPSCDIYYDDNGVKRGEQFVVRVYSRISGINLHFRTNHIRKSLKQAVKAVREL